MYNNVIYIYILYYIYIYIYIYEPPSKSIVDAWYENISYRHRFWRGALSLYSVLFKSTLNNATMQQHWLHGFRSLKCWEWTKGSSVFAFATMLGRYLSIQWFPTVIRSLILWKRKRVTSQLSLFAKPWRQKTPHFPAQEL